MGSARNNIPLSPTTITLIYIVVAGVWIAYTDQILESFVSDSSFLTTLQTYKGWLYVLLTSLGLYYLIKKHDSQIVTKEQELKKTTEALQSEQELKTKLFERIPVLITIYDPDFEAFEVNKEFEKVIGWSNEEIEQKNINLMKVCYPDKETRKEVVNFMNSPGVGWREFNIVAKSGEEIPISWTNVRLTDDTSVGIGIDMSDIKASQTKMRESQKLLKKTFESLKSSLIILDYESRTIIDCNKSTEELFGYSKEELEGSSTRMLHVSEEKFEKFNEIGVAALEEKSIFQTEFVMQKKDGSTFYSDHTVTPVYDEDREIDKVVSVVRDITDRKKNEQELKQRQERLLRSQKIGQIGDWELNPKTKEINWSATMFEIYERDPELGPPSYDEIQTNYYGSSLIKHNEAVKGAIEKKESYDIDLQLKTDKKNKKFVRVIIVPKENEEGEVVKLLGVVQDITKRKETELALNESKERIQNITDNIPGVVFRYILEKDGSDKLEFVSKGAEEIWGISPSEAQEEINLIWENFHPSDIERVQKSISTSAETLTKWNEEWRYIKSEGSVRWQNGIGIPSKGENDSIIWDSIILDITDRKKLEQELKKEKQRFELVAQTTSDVIWDLDLTDNTIWWSKGFEDHFGYDRNKLTDDLSSWTDHIHPEDKVRATESLEKAINGEDKFWQEQYRFKLADGSTAHIIDRGIIIRDENGEAVRMVGTLNNITERIEAEQRLRESEEKYRYLFENNPQPMWIYNPDTLEFVEVNQVAINHYGYSEEEFLNMTLADIRPEEEVEELKATKKKHKSEKSYSGEWNHLKKNGSLINVEVSAANIQYKNETYRLALIHDVTEQKQMQNKIIRSVLEGEDRERKRIAHELHDGLGQHLVAAFMNLESAKTDTDKLPEKRQKQFNTGLSLLKKGLSETRSIAYNLMPKAISDYGLVTALENLVEDFRKGTDINFQLSYNCDDLRLNNRTEINIYRIIQELISNSVRHAEAKTISISLTLIKDSLKLVIKDDGKGTELDDTHESKGLGLRSIKTRVNNLKGDLQIESESERGMKVTILIPDIHKLIINGDS